VQLSASGLLSINTNASGRGSSSEAIACRVTSRGNRGVRRAGVRGQRPGVMSRACRRALKHMWNYNMSDVQHTSKCIHTHTNISCLFSSVASGCFECVAAGASTLARRSIGRKQVSMRPSCARLPLSYLPQ